MSKKKSKFVSIDFDPHTFLTIPNLVTMFRLLTLPFILAFLNKEQNLNAFILIIIAGLTDVLDGFLAKKLNQETTIGKIIDPVIDKIFAVTIIIYLLFFRDFPLWAFISILLLETFILIGGYILAAKYRIVPSSNIFGKIAASILSVSIWVYVIDINFFKNAIILDISLQKIILVIGIVLLIIAAAIYTFAAKRAIKKV